MSENPDAIRADIEATRARLGTNVDAVADKVTPSNIVHRQTDKVKDAVFGVKEKVMGAAEHATHRPPATSTTPPTPAARHQATDAAVHPPRRRRGHRRRPAPGQSQNPGQPPGRRADRVRRRLLVSSLIPASQKEREAADALKTAAEPLTTH